MSAVLVVDQNLDTLNQIYALLSEHGFDVSAAPSYEIALQRAESSQFEVLVINFPDLEAAGIDLHARLRQTLRFRSIAITGKVTPDQAMKYADAGFDFFFSRPLPSESLVLAVRTAAQNPTV